jgi:hypothetical protein
MSVSRSTREKIILSRSRPEIRFVNRNGDVRFVRYVNERRATVTGEACYMRFAADHDTGIIQIADFEGGPCVAVGERIPGAGVVVSVEKWEYQKTNRKRIDEVTVTFTHDATG